MQVLLIRHAEAENRGARWPDDARRPLTKRGRKRFAEFVGEHPQLPPEVDVVATSPLVRAKQTAAVLVDELEWPDPVEWPELEPDADPQAVLERLLDLRNVERVALVGHQPQVAKLLSLLATGSDSALEVEFRKGALAVVDLEPDDGVPGTLVSLNAP